MLDKLLFEQSGAETHEVYKKAIGNKPLEIFVRSILGLDTLTAKELFSSFLSNGPLNSQQIEFINFMINQFSKNGKIEPEMLYEPPFTKFHEQGVSGVFPGNDAKIINIIREVNQRAMVG